VLYTAAELGALDNDAVGPGERRREDRQSPRPNVHAPFTRKVERGGILQELDRSQPVGVADADDQKLGRRFAIDLDRRVVVVT